MVYRVHAEVRFATAAARDAAMATVTTTAAARGMPDPVATALGASGIGLAYNGQTASAVDAQAVYAALSGLAGKQSPSSGSWHACYHGEQAQMCVRLPGNSFSV